MYNVGSELTRFQTRVGAGASRVPRLEYAWDPQGYKGGRRDFMCSLVNSCGSLGSRGSSRRISTEPDQHALLAPFISISLQVWHKNIHVYLRERKRERGVSVYLNNSCPPHRHPQATDTSFRAPRFLLPGVGSMDYPPVGTELPQPKIVTCIFHILSSGRKITNCP